MNVSVEVFKYDGVPCRAVHVWRAWDVNATSNKQSVSLRIGPIAFAFNVHRYVQHAA